MSYQVILFDLDGTLTDPAEGITNAIAHALTYYGIHITDKRTLYPLIGPPLHDSFMRFYGMDAETAYEAIEHYREHFATKGLLENHVYEGVEDMLRQLHAAGKTLVVATAKPEIFSVRILEHFGLAKYFTAICGAPLHPPTGFGKTDVIRDALKRMNITDPTKSTISPSIRLGFSYPLAKYLENAMSPVKAMLVTGISSFDAPYPFCSASLHSRRWENSRLG